MQALATMVYVVLNIYWWVLLAAIVFLWLFQFGVVNPRNQFVAQIGRFLYQVTEPAFRPFRRFIPPLGGFDISPIALFLIITFVQILLYPYTDHHWTG